MDFPAEIRTRARRVQPIVKDTAAAIMLIDRELLPEVAAQPRWTFARDLLIVAERGGRKHDLTNAYRQFRQALSNDKLLDESETHQPPK